LTKRVKDLEKTASVDLTRCENQCLSAMGYHVIVLGGDNPRVLFFGSRLS